MFLVSAAAANHLPGVFPDCSVAAVQTKCHLAGVATMATTCLQVYCNMLSPRFPLRPMISEGMEIGVFGQAQTIVLPESVQNEVCLFRSSAEVLDCSLGCAEGL
jgi:hypothetical protein